MSVAGFSTGYRVPLDSKRRPTLPAALLREAGIDAGHELVARADGHGRVILEDPLVVLATLQAAVAEGKLSHGNSEKSLVDELLEERAADARRD